MGVTLGFTGTGGRGGTLLETCLEIDGVAVTAVCDAVPENREDASDTVEAAGQPAPDRYDDHADLVARDDLDGVVVSTPWRFHIPMAVEAMEAGVHAAIEVGPANSVEECWELVRTHEATGRQCMLLENHCFRRRMMAVLNMVRRGLFGELVHCQGGYEHDLRGRIVTGKGTGIERAGGGDYRSLQNEKRCADLYPTHGVGPVAKYLGVNRGNRFLKLTATASKAAGLEDWSDEHLDPDHPQADTDWANGDIVSTTIKCAGGETIVLSHDTTLPRPYSNNRRVQGTDGIWMENGDSVYVEGRSPEHEWEEYEPYRDEYEHPLWERYREQGVVEGHGGSDYLGLSSFAAAIDRGVTVPVDAYDAAAWMALAPLSEESIANGSQPVSVPDFTGGAWMDRGPIWGLYGDVPDGKLDSTAVL
ncbi:MAG: Gfo/Idh/MocA family protein [Halobacteriaceae archaeon]